MKQKQTFDCIYITIKLQNCNLSLNDTNIPEQIGEFQSLILKVILNNKKKTSQLMNFTEQVNISLENIDIKKLDLNSFEAMNNIIQHNQKEKIEKYFIQPKSASVFASLTVEADDLNLQFDKSASNKLSQKAFKSLKSLKSLSKFSPDRRKKY
eukprot:TRINITY_DN16554_c0_g1_i1.p2 TRINITY_DN16554_c0_g1~~TRINITY_DN16554_c0_g1_i1.p2  ORF type:complete len:153 (-),score=30.62 TRINITY_DN16554_c0_g1_i1:2-460(-)